MSEREEGFAFTVVEDDVVQPAQLPGEDQGFAFTFVQHDGKDVTIKVSQ
jgi:hypothetical protein